MEGKKGTKGLQVVAPTKSDAPAKPTSASRAKTQTVAVGLTWKNDEESIEKLKQKGAFLFVHNDDKKVTPRKITGASKYWNNKDGKIALIFLPEYRLVGLEADLKEALASKKIAGIDKIIRDGIKDESHKLYAKLVEETPSPSKQEKENFSIDPASEQAESSEWRWVHYYAACIKTGKNYQKINSQGESVKGEVSGKKTKTLVEKFQKAKDERKVIVVSGTKNNEDPESGSGVKLQANAGKNDYVITVDGVKVASNDIATLKRAVEVIVGEERWEEFEQNIDGLTKSLKKKVAEVKKASPRKAAKRKESESGSESEPEEKPASKPIPTGAAKAQVKTGGIPTLRGAAKKSS